MDNNEYISKQKVEKWTTKENFIKLGDLRDIEPGTEYNITGAIEEGELDGALQAKINGKLTAPAAPTSESAVILGTDGTVGTKPLSEFKKVYKYDIELQYVTSVDTWSCDTYIYDTEEIETFTIDMLKSKLPEVTNAVLKNAVGWGFFGSIYYPTSTSNKIQFRGDAINNETTPVGQSYYLEIDVDACTIKRVTKNEL